jgi:hypothetical protein
MKVFLLWHTHRVSDGREDEKLIGVYSSLRLAQEAQNVTSEKHGFRDSFEGFEISEYELDTNHWQSGYAIVD